jgi:hypothetical protein
MNAFLPPLALLVIFGSYATDGHAVAKRGLPSLGVAMLTLRGVKNTQHKKDSTF